MIVDSMRPKKDSDVEDGGDKDDGPVMKQPKFKDDLKLSRGN